MSKELPGDPPIQPRNQLYVHMGSGEVYELLHFAVDEESFDTTAVYWDGETVWHRPLEIFMSRFIYVGAL